MAKTTRGQKLGLFGFGLVLVFLFLEIGLRLGGWLFLNLQEGANRRVGGIVGREAEYRILCLGESTTALGGENSYPRQLEQILNSRQNKIKFKVINKGVPATTTEQIVARAENYLNEYQPQMVIAMMGINDPPEISEPTWQEKLSRYSKAFKLLNTIIEHWTVKKKESTDDLIEREIAKLEKKLNSNPVSRIALELTKANLYRSANRPSQEKDAITKVLTLDPQNSQGWYLLGVYYERQAEFQKALVAFQKSLAGSSPNDRIQILDHIAQSYKFLNRSGEAKKIYLDILKQWPDHASANGTLADIFLDEKNYAEASKYFEKQLSLFPNDEDAASKLAHCLRKMGQPERAEKIPSLQKSLLNKAVSYNSRTQKNYLNLAKLVSQQRIPLVAVQYPLRSVEPLKEMLSPSGGGSIFFVENKKVFADALTRAGYDEYFSDRFAGDFGHCTPQGNALLAGHIAEKVLELVESLK